ncbi:hypothetical protein MUN84_21105 [Hymenobacter sp. 5516J-16]|nr:hypothetical protein [Hymenobacter sp. 5516J-16]UOQ76944.1 hypothetical protein MUN84_21105 [Hymenobacter sp. 5516J-16]
MGRLAALGDAREQDARIVAAQLGKPHGRNFPGQQGFIDQSAVGEH